MSHPTKCSHSVYWPANDTINLGCQSCNPDGLPSGPTPILPRSTADALIQKITPITNCVRCGNVRTYCTPNCRVCGTAFPEVDLHEQGPSNKKQPGSCPSCGSNVHYETLKKSEWECVECGTKFKALKAEEVEQ